MKIIITGAAGFIGYHLSKKLLKNKKNQVLGIDSINNYYSIKLKKLRLGFLKKNKNFIFKKINLQNKNQTNSIIKSFKPSVVFHMAGQPGVLYSFKNPKSYKLNNISATKIVTDICKKYKIKKFIYASSSSVYGDQKSFPIRENFKKNPKNFYAKTKLKSEDIIKKTFLKSSTEYMIYRFFSVYGSFGRPDMFIHKYLNAIKKNKKVYLYNNGLNFRDFTYVDDLVKILILSLKKLPKDRVLNICRSKPIRTTKLVSLMDRIYKNTKNKIINTGFVKGEMLKTHGSNKKLNENFNEIIFTGLKVGIKKVIDDFKKFGY